MHPPRAVAPESERLSRRMRATPRANRGCAACRSALRGASSDLGGVRDARLRGAALVIGHSVTTPSRSVALTDPGRLVGVEGGGVIVLVGPPFAGANMICVVFEE